MIRLIVTRVVLSIVLFVALMSAWHFTVRILQVPSFIVPTPGEVFQSFYNGFATGLFWEHIYTTLSEVVVGYSIALCLALTLGSFIALNRTVEIYLYPYIVMFQSMPKVALAPLMVIWFGLGMTSKVVNVAAVCFFPLLVNTIVGLRSADIDRVNLMRSLDAGEFQIFRMLRIPSALPFIMAGLEVAIVLALIGAIVAEFIGAEKGLGMLIQSMTTTLDVAGQFSVLLILSMIGLTLNKMMKLLGNRLLFWDVSRRKNQPEARP